MIFKLSRQQQEQLLIWAGNIVRTEWEADMIPSGYELVAHFAERDR